MNMLYKNIKRLAAVVIASAGTLVACVQMEDQDAAVGYLAVPSLDVDVVVENLMQTKALDFEIEAPEISEIRFVVKDKDGKIKYDADGLWTEPLVLPVGAYTIDAYHGKNGFDAPYFEGSASGTISALDRQSPTISVALENSLVNVTLDTEFAKHFIGEKVTMASGTIEKEFGEWFYVPSGSDLSISLIGKNSAENEKPDAEATTKFDYKLTSPARKTAYSIVCKASSTNWPSIAWTSTQLEDGAFEGGLYFKAAVPSNVSEENASMMKYQIKGGEYADWTDVSVENVGDYKYISGLENDTDYLLRARIGNVFTEEALPFSPVSFQSCLSVGSVTAAHNNGDNADIELSSTTMTANNLKVTLPSIVAGMATVKASGSFSSTVNNATGSFSNVELTAADRNASFTNASDWPYLPQGTYSSTVTAICTLNGATYTATSTETPTVPAPVFKVTVSAYTSYNKYLQHDLDFANNPANKHIVFERKASLSISNNILANTNYSGLCSSSITFNSTNIGSFNTNSKDFGNDTNCTSWQNYPFKASMTFDGVTKEKSVDCHITGLPYTATPPSNDSQKTGGHPWTEDSAVGGGYTYDWGSGYVWFADVSASGNNCLKIGSPEFNVPNNSINVNISVSARGRHVWPVTYNVDTRVYVSSNVYFDFTADYNGGDFKEYSNSTLSLNSSFKKIQIENREHTALNRLHVNSVSITYR